MTVTDGLPPYPAAMPIATAVSQLAELVLSPTPKHPSPSVFLCRAAAPAVAITNLSLVVWRSLELADGAHCSGTAPLADLGQPRTGWGRSWNFRQWQALGSDAWLNGKRT